MITTIAVNAVLCILVLSAVALAMGLPIRLGEDRETVPEGRIETAWREAA